MRFKGGKCPPPPLNETLHNSCRCSLSAQVAMAVGLQGDDDLSQLDVPLLLQLGQDSSSEEHDRKQSRDQELSAACEESQGGCVKTEHKRSTQFRNLHVVQQ